ncbi:MAG: alpha/beta hydrolase [Polyangiaceae bacterium]|nr:alpha/beta hydrolase [Polyangiaceae bacterium]
MNETMIEGVGGLKLFLRSWKPQGPARAVIVAVHGFKSHAGYYDWPAERLQERGFAIYAFDLRGHGRSEGERLYAEKVTEFTGDVDIVVKRARAENPGLPVFILGHSAGGVISCMYVLEHQEELAGFICHSFAHEVPAPDFALAVLKGLSHIAPHAHVLKLDDEGFSRDPKVVERMKTDPLIPQIGYPSLTVAELVRADDLLKREGFARIKLPVLILHGTADKVTLPSGSQRFARDGGSADKTLHLYEDYAHDLFNDVGRERPMADVIEWLTARLPR